ncbi:Pentatricopeptide repeat [Macleaya cordata]|uniref:Pentatricopeptide repeat n=1 Tax=Macleaya cordata TaxID=56857 RepID=A0A200Q363_MACCD|nr:Pentatricopeptide repeat [Macleaya cordata]
MNRIWSKTANHFSNVTHQSEFQSKVLSLCKHGRLKEALQILDSEPIVPLDPSLYSPILQLCIDSKAKKEGRLVHEHLLRNGFHSDLYLNTKLIIFYAKTGDVENARLMFDNMPQRSVVSWTAMISGYSQNGYSKEALEFFSVMHQSGVKANQFTYGSVLRACTSVMCLERGKQIQGCIVKSRFWEDLFVQSALVDFHSKCGMMEDARFLFEKLEKRDVVCWNAVIGGYALQGLADDSFGMFRLMLNEGMMPDHFSFGSLLRACSGNKLFTKVDQIHGFIVHLGFQAHGIVNGSLIDAYAKCGSVRSARLVYDFMREKDLISCTALITGYAREGTYSGDALDLFFDMYRMGMGVDDVVLCSMLNICANIASLSLGRQIHALALKNQPNYDTAMGNALIDMYAKSGEIEDTKCAFDEMREKNVISWTSLITGYGKHGYGEKAMELFEKMKHIGLKPNDVTFLSVLFACSHTGLTKKGWECFNSMITEYNINPRDKHYSCMVDLFARRGQLEEAYDLVYKMNVQPNASLWGAILGASKIHGSTSLGEVAARHLFDLEPENSVNYVVLAGIYAQAGLWEDAWKTRKLIEDRGMKKKPGFSFVQDTTKEIPLLLETN